MPTDAVDDSLRGIDRTGSRSGSLVAASACSTTSDAHGASRTADDRAEVDHS